MKRCILKAFGVFLTMIWCSGCGFTSSTCEVDRLEENGVTAVAVLRDSLTSDSRLWILLKKGGSRQLEIPLDPAGSTFEAGLCFISMAFAADGRYVGIIAKRCVDGHSLEYALDVESGHFVDSKVAIPEVMKRAKQLYSIPGNPIEWLRDQPIRKIQESYHRRVPSCENRWK